MDIETKQICRNCKEELPELTVAVMCEVNITWNDEDAQYEAHGGNFDLNEVNEFYCPKCYRENIIDPEKQKQANTINIDNSIGLDSMTDKRVLTSFFSSICSFVSKKVKRMKLSNGTKSILSFLIIYF